MKKPALPKVPDPLLCSNGFVCRQEKCRFWSMFDNECIIILAARKTVELAITPVKEKKSK